MDEALSYVWMTFTRVVSSLVVTDALWRKGPGLILRQNPGCTSVIYGRIWSQKDSRSLIPKNRVFGWNFYLMKRMNSISLVAFPPNIFPGMTELYAGYESDLYQDTPFLPHLWPTFVKTQTASGQIQNVGFANLFWHSPYLISNYQNIIKCLENKFSRESCRGGIRMQISTSSKIMCFPKRNKINLTSDIYTSFFWYSRNGSLAN